MKLKSDNWPCKVNFKGSNKRLNPKSQLPKIYLEIQGELDALKHVPRLTERPLKFKTSKHQASKSAQK